MVIEFGDPAVTKSMMCPHCQVPLAMSSRQNIEIDYCPKCRGVWLDRGELDKIIERSVEDTTPPPQTQSRPEPQRSDRYDDRKRYRDDDDDDDDRYRRRSKKKKSWLYEIFDELT